MQIESVTIVWYIDLEVTSSETDALARDASYSCVGVGYPDTQLLMWQTGTGDRISDLLYNTTREIQSFSTMLNSTLAVNSRDACIWARGYVCTFSNGGVPKSQVIHCIPGKAGVCRSPKTLGDTCIKKDLDLCMYILCIRA